jgi:ferritin-like metal-binding protein YciE
MDCHGRDRGRVGMVIAEEARPPLAVRRAAEAGGSISIKELVMEMNSLQDVFVDELRDLLNAEQKIIKTLPKMAKKAGHRELQSAFQEHLEQTKGQVQRLEKIFESMGMAARGKRCKGIEGIIEEGQEMIEESEDQDLTDAVLIGAAQKVEHYEIAAYGTVRTYAQLLGNTQAARLLQQTLDEEKETDRKLTELAEGNINAEAAHTPAA